MTPPAEFDDASVTHAVVNPPSTEPALGASGAIAGVMGCYMRLFPWARIVAVIPVLFFPFFFELPAIVVIGFWFAIQILNGLKPHYEKCGRSLVDAPPAFCCGE